MVLVNFRPDISSFFETNSRSIFPYSWSRGGSRSMGGFKYLRHVRSTLSPLLRVVMSAVYFRYPRSIIRSASRSRAKLRSLALKWSDGLRYRPRICVCSIQINPGKLLDRYSAFKKGIRRGSPNSERHVSYSCKNWSDRFNGSVTSTVSGSLPPNNLLNMESPKLMILN